MEAVYMMKTEDQMFERGNYIKKKPQICPCLLPGSKYVVTKTWKVLSGKDTGFQNTSLLIQSHACTQI